MAYHLCNQLLSEGVVRLPEGSDGYDHGVSSAAISSMDDVVEVILWLLDHGEVSGIFNVGTGRSQSFNEVAMAVQQAFGRGTLKYIPFPDQLSRAAIRASPRRDISRLRNAGYNGNFRDVATGVGQYMRWLTDAAVMQ